jgi:hypothetical protein
MYSAVYHTFMVFVAPDEVFEAEALLEERVVVGVLGAFDTFSIYSVVASLTYTSIFAINFIVRALWDARVCGWVVGGADWTLITFPSHQLIVVFAKAAA